MAAVVKYLLLVQALVALLAGAPLLAAPGSFLGLFGWGPVEPVLCRIFGAALLAMAWGFLQGHRWGGEPRVTTLVQMGAIWNGLGFLGVFRHLLLPGVSYPLMVWIVGIVLGLFAMAWAAAWVRK
jgi:hypothetical protein